MAPGEAQAREVPLVVAPAAVEAPGALDVIAEAREWSDELGVVVEADRVWSDDWGQHVHPVRGSEGAVILVFNHRSYFDPTAINLLLARAGRNARFLGKKEVFDVPAVLT